MARSRNIKPGFFQNDDLVELDFSVRLLFIGLWTLADREGRLENRPKKIKMQLFPADELDMHGALTGLSDKKLITMYSIDNVEYIQIDNFLKHQHPHIKEQASNIPAPDMHGASPSDSLIPITDSLIPIKDKPSPEKQANGVPYQKIVDLYHKELPTLPRVEKLTATRKSQIRQRWKQGDLPDLNNWENFFDYVGQSKFLMGGSQATNGRKSFVSNLEWLTKESNFVKITEGNYHL